MTHHAAAPSIPPTDRFVQRYAVADLPWPAHYIHAIADTLANGLDVEFTFGADDASPWFRLRSYRGAVHVLGPDFGHLATMASVSAALVRGWEVGGYSEAQNGACGPQGVALYGIK